LPVKAKHNGVSVFAGFNFTEITRRKKMNNKTHTTLEFDKILNMLSDLALSKNIKDKVIALTPCMREIDVLRHLEQTTQGKAIIERAGTPPIAALDNLNRALGLVEQNAVLAAEDLGYVSQFIVTCKRMKTYLNKCKDVSPDISSYAGSIYELNAVQNEIASSIRGDKVDDRASTQLYSIRRKIVQTGEQIKQKVNQSLSSNKQYLSEYFVSFRNGHYTLPVKAQFKGKINGSVIDMSGSGGTYFIEPSSVKNLQDKLTTLEIDEENEIRRILCVLTDLVEEHTSEIKINTEAMELLDFIFAKAKLSLKMKARAARINTVQHIVLEGGKHPFIDERDVVPLDFEMNNDNKRCVIITGPNTGGKTVVLKTIGLFSLMTQCGLHIPASDADFCMQNMVLYDIGDGQSITENLSTFSSHITNIIEIIKKADEQSLVILDELGSGTDPTEGMGIATAILEELDKKNCLLLATTHYPEIKSFAKKHEGFINARMTFDKENMKPLYQLKIGEAGESCALYIAKRLGMSTDMIKRAYQAAYYEDTRKQKEVVYDEELLNASTDEKERNVNINPKIIIKDNKLKQQKEVENKFTIGDSVMVYPEKVNGIVYQKADSKGEFGVMIKREKQLINHKRLKLLVSASELYPDNYDMSIVFDTVDNRKARKKMTKKHDPDAVVIIKA